MADVTGTMRTTSADAEVVDNVVGAQTKVGEALLESDNVDLELSSTFQESSGNVLYALQKDNQNSGDDQPKISTEKKAEIAKGLKSQNEQLRDKAAQNFDGTPVSHNGNIIKSDMQAATVTNQIEGSDSDDVDPPESPESDDEASDEASEELEDPDDPPDDPDSVNQFGI